MKRLHKYFTQNIQRHTHIFIHTGSMGGGMLAAGMVEWVAMNILRQQKGTKPVRQCGRRKSVAFSLLSAC